MQARYLIIFVRRYSGGNEWGVGHYVFSRDGAEGMNGQQTLGSANGVLHA